MSSSSVESALGKAVVIEAIEDNTGASAIAPDRWGRQKLPAPGYVPQACPIEFAARLEIEHFLYQQSAMLDAKDWNGFVDLFTDDGLYWMPAVPEQTDWEGFPSIFVEDRTIMSIRAGRLQHPNAWSQDAEWGTHHMVGNLVVESIDTGTAQVYSRFTMMELRRDSIRHFGGSYRHQLVRDAGRWRIRHQRVDLLNGQAAFDYVLQAWV